MEIHITTDRIEALAMEYLRRTRADCYQAYRAYIANSAEPIDPSAVSKAGLIRLAYYEGATDILKHLAKLVNTEQPIPITSIKID